MIFTPTRDFSCELVMTPYTRRTPNQRTLSGPQYRPRYNTITRINISFSLRIGIFFTILSTIVSKVPLPPNPDGFSEHTLQQNEGRTRRITNHSSLNSFDIPRSPGSRLSTLETCRSYAPTTRHRNFDPLVLEI
jgi:hypothetical protein